MVRQQPLAALPVRLVAQLSAMCSFLMTSIGRFSNGGPIDLSLHPLGSPAVTPVDTPHNVDRVDPGSCE